MPRRVAIVTGLIVLGAIGSISAEAKTGLVVCSQQPLKALNKKKTTIFAFDKSGHLANDLKRTGFLPNFSKMGHWSDLTAVLQVYKDKTVAFYDTNIVERTDALHFGDNGARLKVDVHAKHCEVVLETPVCDGFLPCAAAGPKG